VQEVPGGGVDIVIASADFTMPANVEALYMNGSGLAGTGTAGADSLISVGGPNTLVGLGGNDTYFVNNSSDIVQEAPGGGFDSVFAAASFTIPTNVEVLYMNGSGLTGTGSAGNETLTTLGGPNTLAGAGGNDTFWLMQGQANGTTMTDFDGNGAGAGDNFVFTGYGPGASFTNVDATHWQINYAGGTQHDVITLLNGAPVDPSDFLFI